MDERHPSASHPDVCEDLRSEGFAVNTSDLEGTNYMAVLQTRDQLAAAAKPYFRDVLARPGGGTILQQAVLGLIREG